MANKVTFTPENIDPEQELLNIAREQIEEIIKEMVCPKHGDKPVVEVTFSEDSKLRFNLGGCCDEFLEEVYKKIESLTT